MKEMMGLPRVRDLCVLEIKYTDLTHTSGLHALCTAVMENQTLADLVAGIFTGVTDTLKTVKHNLQTTWDGIKGAGQFIGNQLILAIHESFAVTLRMIFMSMVSIFSVVNQIPVQIDMHKDGFNLTNLQSGTQISLDVKSSIDGISILKDSNIVVRIRNPLSKFQYTESLGVPLNVSVAVLAFSVLTSISITALASIIRLLQDKPFYASLSIVLWTLSTFLLFTLMNRHYENESHEESNMFVRKIKDYFTSLFIGLFLSLLFDGKNFSISALIAILGKEANEMSDKGDDARDQGVSIDKREVAGNAAFSTVITISALLATTAIEYFLGSGSIKLKLYLIALILPVFAFSYFWGNIVDYFWS